MEVDVDMGSAAESEADEDKMDFETSSGSPEPCCTPSQVKAQAK